MYAAARSRQEAHPVIVGGGFNIWMDVPGLNTTQSFMTSWSACGFAKASGDGSTPLALSRLTPLRRLDSFLLNSPTLPWSAQETVWGAGVHPEILGSDALPIIIRLPLARSSREALLKASFCHEAFVRHRRFLPQG